MAEIAIHVSVQNRRIERCDHKRHQNEQWFGCGKLRGIFLYNVDDNVMDEIHRIGINANPCDPWIIQHREGKVRRALYREVEDRHEREPLEAVAERLSEIAVTP